MATFQIKHAHLAQLHYQSNPHTCSELAQHAMVHRLWSYLLPYSNPASHTFSLQCLSNVFHIPTLELKLETENDVRRKTKLNLVDGEEVPSGGFQN